MYMGRGIGSGRGNREKTNENREFISDIWGKRGPTYGEKGGAADAYPLPELFLLPEAAPPPAPLLRMAASPALTPPLLPPPPLRPPLLPQLPPP